MSYCSFCTPEQSFESIQLLLKGQYFYLFAPKGAPTEGYLMIVPYLCQNMEHTFRCFADMPSYQAGEFETFKKFVEEFYRYCYGVSVGLYYEQGRGGGENDIDLLQGYSYHAHLCCIPADIDIHTSLRQRFDSIVIDTYEEIARVYNNMAYLFVEGVDFDNVIRKRLFYVPDGDIERALLRVIIAEKLGVPPRLSWREYPGNAEIAETVSKFNGYLKKFPEILSLIGRIG